MSIIFKAQNMGDLNKQIRVIKRLKEEHEVKIQIFSTDLGLIYRAISTEYDVLNKMWELSDIFPHYSSDEIALVLDRFTQTENYLVIEL